MIAYSHTEDQYGREIAAPTWQVSSTTGGPWSESTCASSLVVNYFDPWWVSPYEETNEERKHRLWLEHRTECQQAFRDKPRRILKQGTRVAGYRDYRRHGER